MKITVIHFPYFVLMTAEQKHDIIKGIEKKLVEDTLLLERSRRSSALHKSYRDALKNVNPTSSFEEFEELNTLNNFQAYSIFSLLDLYVTIKYLLIAKTDWERIYFIKHGYLIVFEALDTYNLHNKSIGKLLSLKYPSMLNGYKTVAKEISDYSKKHGYRPKMAEMRNTIIAHIKTDFDNYYDAILKLDGETGINALVSFMVILQHLQEFLGMFVTEANQKWIEDGVIHQESIDIYISKIEELFQQQGTDTKELIEMKNNLFKIIASIKENLKPSS